MSNLYSLVAELIISNAMKDSERSKGLAQQLYMEMFALNTIIETVTNEAVKLQPITERDITGLN